jgi:hypothetical protein
VSQLDEPGNPLFSPAAIVAALNRHQVRYGHRVARPIPATRGIDITPEASAENLSRLSRALTGLGARIRAEPNRVDCRSVTTPPHQPRLRCGI